MGSFTEAIKKPFSDWKILLIGSAITAVPILNFAAIGYALQCVTNHGSTMQKWEAIPRLWYEGFLATIGSMLYVLPSVAIMLITTMTIFSNYIPGPIGAQVNIAPWQHALIIIGALSFILAQYIIPSAQIHYAVDGKFKAFFEFREIITYAFTLPYLKTALKILALALIMGVITFIANALLFITIIGPFIIQGILTFALFVTMFTLFGETYLEGN